MTMLNAPQNNEARGLSLKIVISAPIADSFASVAMRTGIAAWWTPLVSKAVALGKEFQIGFEGLEEIIRIRVDESIKPQIVRWTVIEHTGLPEWNGTNITFAFTELGPAKSNLNFRHEGLVPPLACYSDCKAGWNHFLTSLANVAAGRPGNPFRG